MTVALSLYVDDFPYVEQMLNMVSTLESLAISTFQAYVDNVDKFFPFATSSFPSLFSKDLSTLQHNSSKPYGA